MSAMPVEQEVVSEVDEPRPLPEGWAWAQLDLLELGRVEAPLQGECGLLEKRRDPLGVTEGHEIRNHS